jgi:hypothetical protein
MNYEKTYDFKKLFLLSNGNIACGAFNNGGSCIAVFDKNFKLDKDMVKILR